MRQGAVSVCVGACYVQGLADDDSTRSNLLFSATGRDPCERILLAEASCPLALASAVVLG